MNSELILQNLIFEGLENSCKDILRFNSDFDFRVKPEYLLTVNIAKSFSAYNENQYPPPFNIKLEEKTEKVVRKCVPIFHSDKNAPYHIFNMKMISGKKVVENEKTKNNDLNTDRNGKIDIVIYETMNDTPVTAIEVKLINPKKNGIVTDLIRIEELLYIQDTNTGISELKETYFVCIDINRKAKNNDDCIKHFQKSKNRYSKIARLTLKPSTKFEVIQKKLMNELLIDNQKFTDDLDYNNELFNRCQSVIGTIIRITKN